jgi:hypothetical protein
VRGADRGGCSYAPLALRVPPGVHAVLRLWARPSVDFTPGRPLVTPGVRRTPAGKGLPRSRWRQTVGGHDQLVTCWKPNPGPSWLTREAVAARPEAVVLREGRDPIRTPGFRTRQSPVVTTLLDPERDPGTDRAAWYRQRWAGEPALAHLKTTRPMDVRHGKTVPGVRQARTVWAIVYHLVRLGMGQSATLQHLSVERLSCLHALRWLGAPSPGSPLEALVSNPTRP